MRDRLRRFVAPRGDERALDVGTGTGTLALALAPLVREVVGLDLVPEMLERMPEAAEGAGHRPVRRGRRGGASRFADGELRPRRDGSRTLHHVPWPDIAIAEMTRVTRLGGRLLVDRPDRVRRPARGARAQPHRAPSRPEPRARALRPGLPRALRRERSRAAPLRGRARGIATRRLPRSRGVRGRRARRPSTPRSSGCSRSARPPASSFGAPASGYGLTLSVALVPARARAAAAAYDRHLTVQPTAGVSATGGASPASTASSAWRRYGVARRPDPGGSSRARRGRRAGARRRRERPRVFAPAGMPPRPPATRRAGTGRRSPSRAPARPCARTCRRGGRSS